MADDDDSEGVYVCYDCVGDAYPKEEIRRDGHKRECHFCGKTQKAWPLEELAERVQAVIEQHFRTTPSDPSEEGFPYDKEPTLAMRDRADTRETKPGKQTRDARGNASGVRGQKNSPD